MLGLAVKISISCKLAYYQHLFSPLLFATLPAKFDLPDAVGPEIKIILTLGPLV